MPRRPPRPCARCAVRYATQGSYCDLCGDKRQLERDSYHGTKLRHLYFTDEWKRARVRFLNEHPFCHECEDGGRLEPATVVDHDPPHRDNEHAFWDRSTWRPKCKPHHDEKTAREMGERRRESQ